MPIRRSDDDPKQTARPARGERLTPRQSLTRRNVVPSFSESIGSFVLEVAKVVIISLAIIIPVRYFLIQPFYVKGASMEPNFYDNEYLVVDEISYRLSPPNRGDVVVIRNPKHESDFLIKRVVGLPGERVEIMNGEVTVFNTAFPSGVTLDENAYLELKVRTSSTVDVTLSDDEFFVLGDNRDSSLDSRYFGAITRREIVGRAWIRAWPVNRLSLFSTPKYPEGGTKNNQ